MLKAQIQLTKKQIQVAREQVRRYRASYREQIQLARKQKNLGTHNQLGNKCSSRNISCHYTYCHSKASNIKNDIM